MTESIRSLTSQQRAVFAVVSHYYEAVGQPVRAPYVAERLGITKQRVHVYFRSLYELGWLKSPGAPAIPTRRFRALPSTFGQR